MEATRNSPLLQILRVDCGLVSNKEVIRPEAKVGLIQSPIAVVALTMLEMSVGWWRVKSLAAEICTFSSSPGRNHLHPSLVLVWPSPASAEFSYVIVFFGSIVQPMGDVCLCMSITWATFNFAGDRDQFDPKVLCPGAQVVESIARNTWTYLISQFLLLGDGIMALGSLAVIYSRNPL